MAPEFTDEPSAGRMTPAERRAADLANLAKAEQYGADRRAGEIRDPGCDSVSRWLPTWLAQNPTAAEAVERQRQVERRAE